MQQTNPVEKAIKIIQTLPEEKVKAALYYLEYLAHKEEMNATAEILADEEMMATIRKADKAYREGKLDEFLPFEELKNV